MIYHKIYSSAIKRQNMFSKSVLLLCLMFFFSGCNKNDLLVSYRVSGQIQKGPFLAGSQIIIQPLDDSLFYSTGMVYYTYTTDDFGSYNFQNELSNKYVEIIADGFFYNEVKGEVSDASIMLRHFCSIDASSGDNINILTTLASERIKYLVLTDSLSYESAKTKAQKEILKVFNITDSVNIDFGEMDISSSSDFDAILLAISCIIQGNKKEAEISEYITKFIMDLKYDGTIDNPDLYNYLIENAEILNLIDIRENLKNRYESLGQAITVPPFEKYVQLLTPVAIIYMSHENGEEDVFLDDTFKIRLNKPLDQTTLNEENLWIELRNSKIDISYEYFDSTEYLIQLIPSVLLLPETSYTIHLGSGLKGVDNSSVENELVSFRTIDVDPSSGILSHYSLNGDLNDDSGNNKHAIASGGLFNEDKDSNTESCYSLTTSSVYIQFPNILNIEAKEWSYSLWFNIDSYSEHALISLLGTKNSGNAFWDFPLYILPTPNSFITTYGGAKLVADTQLIETKTWYHVVFVVDNCSLAIYIDGDIHATIDNVNHWKSDESFRSYEDEYYIGMTKSLDNPVEFIGSVDEITFYDRAVNKFEVKEIYSAV